MRPDTLIDIARRWRLEVPARFRLGFDVQHDRHHGSRLAELRVCHSLMRCEDWEPKYQEQACSILEIRLTADKKRTKLDHQVIAAISLHAMARWFQR